MKEAHWVLIPFLQWAFFMAAKKDKKWIQKAIKKPGALRKAAGVKAGEKIPAKKLTKLAKKKGVTGQRARLAKTLGKMRKKK